MTTSLNTQTGVIFDMDGTLLDTMPYWNTIGSDYLKAHGIAATPDLDEQIMLQSIRQTAEVFKNDYGVAGTVDEIENEIYAACDGVYENQAELKPGVAELISLLKQSNIPMCVLTASSRYQVEVALGRLGILDKLDPIITCQETGLSKDRPDIFTLAARKLGVSCDNVVVVEDAVHALKSAKAAGMRTIGVFDASYQKYAEQVKAASDLYTNNIANSLDDIVTFITAQ